MPEESMTSRLLGKAPRKARVDEDDAPETLLPLPGLMIAPAKPDGFGESDLMSRKVSSASVGSVLSDGYGFGESDDEDNPYIDEEAPDPAAPLHEGWKIVESRSNPGQYVYENIHTLERQAWKPDQPASKTDSLLAAILDPDKVAQEFPSVNPAAAFFKEKLESGGTVGRKWAKQWKTMESEEANVAEKRIRLKSKSKKNSAEQNNQYSIDVKTSSKDKWTPMGLEGGNSTSGSWKKTLRRKLSSKTVLDPSQSPTRSPSKSPTKPQLARACCATVPLGISKCPTCGRSW